MPYLFGVYNGIEEIVAAGNEGLLLDFEGNKTSEILYNRDNYYTQEGLNNRRSFYELDYSKPLEPQLDYRTMGRFVKEGLLDNYNLLKNDLLATIDLGGATEKDRLKATEDETGIFSFGLAAPSLYRMVEWYVPELDKVVESHDGVIENINGSFYFRPDSSKETPSPKHYRCLRQQKGTHDILKYVPNARRIQVSEGFYATEPRSGMGNDGHEYKLKFATREKKVFLKRPKAGGVPQYVDIFVPCGATKDLNSTAMMAKITPVVMIAEQLEQGGAKVRIYGLRAYTVSGTKMSDGSIAMYQVFLSWVAKEYGAPIDVNDIALRTADPRFFRWQLWQLTEGIARKAGFRLDGYGTTIYGGNELRDGFQLYKNFLMQKKEQGFSTSKVNDKALLITGSLKYDDLNNTWRRNTAAIEREYYRLADMSEILLAKKKESAIDRIIRREREKSVRDIDIKQRLLGLFDDAFYTRTANNLNSDAKQYADDVTYQLKVRERREEIMSIINRRLP
jgi:hypothetical protein